MYVQEMEVPDVRHSGEKNIFPREVLTVETAAKAEMFFWLETTAKIPCWIFHFSSISMQKTGKTEVEEPNMAVTVKPCSYMSLWAQWQY